jgi:hypothetical protein
MLPDLQPGVYRTRDLPTKNKTRFAKMMVGARKLQALELKGLFMVPKKTRFGNAPPPRKELVAAFLRDDDFVFTGPEAWNALGLGTTAVFANHLVYNKKRTVRQTLAGQPFQFCRRVRLPPVPTSEWYAVDLLENAGSVGSSRAALLPALASALRVGRFDSVRLLEAAAEYGNEETRATVTTALKAAASE